MEQNSSKNENSKKKRNPKKRLSRKYSQNEKLIPALKNESRFNRKGTMDQSNEVQGGVKWDNQVIDQTEQKNKASKIKTDDLKTHYPKENVEKDLYDEALNETKYEKGNDELINKVILLLRERVSKCDEESAHNIINEFLEKCKNLDEEGKKTLKNTLMNKYQNLVKSKVKGV